MKLQDVTVGMLVQGPDGEGGISEGTVLAVYPEAERGCEVLVAWEDSGDKSVCSPEGLEKR